MALNFAAARLGLVLVPINFMLNATEVAFILTHSGAIGFVVDEALQGVGTQALDQSTGIKVLGSIGAPGTTPAGWSDVGAWVNHADESEPTADVADDDPLQPMYTSRKGVVIAQYVSCIVDGGMTHDDIEVHALPLYHCAQLYCFLVPDIYLGATSIILPGADPEQLLATIARESVTKLFAPPAVWIALLLSPSFDTTDLSSLRKGYYGASAMLVQVLQEIQDRLPDVRLWNFYGQTEMAPVATILPPEEQLSHAGAAGRAVLNVETRVVDDDDIEVAPRCRGGKL